MMSRLPAGSPATARVFLAGSAAGVLVTSHVGAAELAGFLAVALAVGVFAVLPALVAPGRGLAVVAAALAAGFPFAVAAQEEAGILWATAVASVLLPAGFVLRGRRRSALPAVGMTLLVVLQLGMLGSYLVLLAGIDPWMPAGLLVLVMVFEVGYALLGARAGPGARGAPAGSWAVRARPVLGAVVACQAVAVVAGTAVAIPLRVSTLLLLGLVVGAGAALGHAAAEMLVGQRNRAVAGPGVDPGLVTYLSVLLFAAGALYYALALYLV